MQILILNSLPQIKKLYVKLSEQLIFSILNNTISLQKTSFSQEVIKKQ